jgi:hypothetical protein
VTGSRLTIGTHRTDRGRDLAAPRRVRRRPRQVLARVAAVVTLVGLLAGGGYWLLTAPTFAVSRVESGRYRFSDEAAVEAALSRCLGLNIWRLTHADVDAACADLPWVRRVSVQRRLPATIVVTMTEWRPLLGVATESHPDGSQLLVPDGRVLTAPAHLDVPALPLLVGCEPVRGPDGAWRLAGPELASVMALIEALEQTGLESDIPVDFVRHTHAGFVLELQGRAGSLLLGHEDFPRRLARYLLARERIPAGAAVDLRFEDRVTFEAPAEDRT